MEHWWNDTDKGKLKCWEINIIYNHLYRSGISNVYLVAKSTVKYNSFIVNNDLKFGRKPG
jgi:hypothetical protein